MKPLIEICLGNAQGVLAAQNGGADRVELCSDLLEGGLTPTLGTFRTARKLADKIKIFVMIRPRGGDFCYSEEEYLEMKEDIRIFKEEGADGFVFGILNPDGSVDEKRNAELLSLCGSDPVTFHRAFDMTSNGNDSLETIIKLGFSRILTSGQKPTAMEGAQYLAELVKQAGDRIVIMPGCGVNASNINALEKITGAKEYHMSAASEYDSKMIFRNHEVDFGNYKLKTTDEERVREICRTC